MSNGSTLESTLEAIAKTGPQELLSHFNLTSIESAAPSKCMCVTGIRGFNEVLEMSNMT